MRDHRLGMDGAAAHTLKIVRTRYGSTDSQRLIDELQAEYVWRYGWRWHDPDTSGSVPGSSPAEIKRMYVREPPSRSTGAADTSRSLTSDSTQTHRSRCTSGNPYCESQRPGRGECFRPGQ